MTPPCHTFNASELPVQAQLDVHGRRRKPDTSSSSSSAKLDLSACELLQMLQYKCEVQRPLSRDSPVQCFAVDRLFRRCKDKKGSFLVETTAWEGNHTTASPKDAATPEPAKAPRPYQWSGNWHDPDTPPSG